MNLPAVGYISNSLRTTAEQKVALEDQRNFIAALVGGQAEGALTIASGTTTPGSEDSGRAKASYAFDTEGLSASDDLTNITTTNCHNGMMLLIRCANDSRNVIVKHSSGGGGEISLANGLDFPMKSVRQWLLLQLRGGTWIEIDRGPLIGSGRWEILGYVGANNSGTPNTQWDMSAQAVTLRSPVDGSTVARFNTGTLTNNLSTAGPTAGGRDQSGAFSASSWVHFYFIWNGTTLSTLSSAVAPPTGPTLPTGYTHWSYAGVVRFDSGSALLRTFARGRRHFHRGAQQCLSSGSATSNTPVSVANQVPPNALAYEITDVGWAANCDSSGALSMDLEIHIESGTIHTWMVRPSLSGLAASAQVRTASGTTLRLPNIGQSFAYKWLITLGSAPVANISVASYEVANGDA